jgi:hypothetical protein
LSIGTEEAGFQEGGWPALVEWLSIETGIPEDEIRIRLADAFIYSTDIQPYDVFARLKGAAAILDDPEGSGIGGLMQVINEFVTTPAPPSEEEMTRIAEILAGHVGDGTHYAAAEAYIDAFVEYASILINELGWSPAESVKFVMDKYGAPIQESGNASLVAYLQARLAQLGG